MCQCIWFFSTEYFAKKNPNFVSFCGGHGGNDFTMSLWKRGRMFLKDFRPGILENSSTAWIARPGNQRGDDVDRNKD